MRKIQKRESELIKSVSVALRFIRSSRGLGAQDVRWTSALRGLEWNGDFPNKQKYAGYILGHCLPMSKKERISFMVKNKVVIKERDAWSDLANFIGEMVAKYAEAMDLDNLQDPDRYLLVKRIKQLHVEFYKSKNIEKFRNTKISIERKVAA